MITLILNHVLKKYNGKIVLNNLEFTFNGGNMYIIRGESGAGKTTLLNIIAGYVHADEGKVERNLDYKIEYLFQDEMLFSNLTVKENMYIKYVALYSDDAGFDQTAQDALGLFHIVDLMNRKVAMLSSGEKRRVQLANVLMSDPDIVLMDEPTLKLDGKNGKIIWDTIAHTFRSKLVIIVSHERDQIDQMLSNSIHLTLEDGSLHYG